MDSYIPVSVDFTEQINNRIREGTSGLVHYFIGNEKVGMSKGRIENIQKKDNGEFIKMTDGNLVRLDTIITLFGRPGPAYDVYASHSSSCADASTGDD